MKVFSFVGRGALILASAGLAMACSKMAASLHQPSSSPTPAAVTTATTPVPSQNPEDKIPRISVEEAKKLVDAGKAVIIDVRGTEAYKGAHIKGALDYGLTTIEKKDFSGLPKGKQIIAYCT